MNDKIPQDEQWQSLVADWQAQPTPDVNISQLVEKTQKRARRAKWLFALDVAACLVLLILLVVEVFQYTRIDIISFLVIVLLASVYYTGYEYQTRIAIWQHSDSKPGQYWQACVKEAHASIRFFKMAQWWTLVMSAVIVAHLGWSYGLDRLTNIKLWIFIVIVNLMAVLICGFKQKRRLSELKQLQALMAVNEEQ